MVVCVFFLSGGPWPGAVLGGGGSGWSTASRGSGIFRWEITLSSFTANSFVYCQTSVSAEFQKTIVCVCVSVLFFSFLRRTVAWCLSGWRREWMEHGNEKCWIFRCEIPFSSFYCKFIRLMSQIGFGCIFNDNCACVFLFRRTMARGLSGWRREWMEHCIGKF